MKLSSPEKRAGARELWLAFWLILIATVVGLSLRLPQLDLRPMHTDETTQAIKFRDLLSGTYEYDPVEHHGPTLLYFTKPVKWLAGAESFQDMTEVTLRLTPLLFGMALILLMPLLADALGRASIGWAALLLAVSPIFVFYSRYYIMEMLLVFFTFSTIACGWRFYVTRSVFWLVLCAASAGLMHATKETFVLHVAAMFGGLGVVMLSRTLVGGMLVSRNRPQAITLRHYGIFLAVAAVVSVACFTQGFTHWKGAVDSVATYGKYLGRAAGQGHEKPWHYYLQLLGWNQGGKFWAGPAVAGEPSPAGSTFLWTELGILLFALVGMARAFMGRAKTWQREFAIFLAVYSVLVFAAYSLISYKTPWCILTAHHGFILLAGFGVSGLAGLIESRAGRIIGAAFVLAVAAHLALQSWTANFKDDRSLAKWLRTRDAHSSTDNPYAYGFTPMSTRDGIVAKLNGYAERSPDGLAINVQVAAPGGPWPLPWYLRKFTRVAYWPDLQQRDGSGFDLNADVLLVDPEFIKQLPESIRGADFSGSATYAMDMLGMLNQQYWIQGYVKRSLLPGDAAAPPPPPPLELPKPTDLPAPAVPPNPTAEPTPPPSPVPTLPVPTPTPETPGTIPAPPITPGAPPVPLPSLVPEPKSPMPILPSPIPQEPPPAPTAPETPAPDAPATPAPPPTKPS